jgi:hypothetical protein
MVKRFKSFLNEDFEQYLNKAGDRFTWNPDDITIGQYNQVEESILETHEEWLGTDDPLEGNGKLFYEIKDNNHKHIENTKGLYAPSKYGPTTSAIEAMDHYLGSGHRQMNHLARHGEVPDDYSGRVPREKLEEYNKHLQNAIMMHSTLNPIHVWRGFGNYGRNFNFNSGDTFHDKGFVSTSTHPRIAKLFARNYDPDTAELLKEPIHIAHIKLPVGSNVIHPLSHHNHSPIGENEIILPRNSHFKYEGNTEHTEASSELHRNPTGRLIVHHLTHIPGMGEK